MAVKRVVVETRLSDLSGTEGTDVSTVPFKFDGKAYKLDLTAAERAEFEGMMARYIEAADNAKTQNGGTADEDDTNAIRQWGRDHGFEVGSQGRLSASLKAAYYAAQSTPGNGQEVEQKGKEKAGK